MLNGHGELPAFPMRVACDNAVTRVSAASASSHYTGNLLAEAQERLPQGHAASAKPGDRDGSAHWQGPGRPGASPKELLAGLAAAAGVWYNYTGAMQSCRLAAGTLHCNAGCSSYAGEIVGSSFADDMYV